MTEEIPTQTQEQINEFLSDKEEPNDWIYTLRQSEDKEETIDLFDNAGDIIIKRCIFEDDKDMLREELHVKGGALNDLIENYFNSRVEKFKP